MPVFKLHNSSSNKAANLEVKWGYKQRCSVMGTKRIFSKSISSKF